MSATEVDTRNYRPFSLSKLQIVRLWALRAVAIALALARRRLGARLNLGRLCL
jgi:hypothetical protein